MPTDESLRLDSVLRAAQLYYLDGLTQAAVADRLGCTRWTVGRLLAEAERVGLLRVEIRHPRARRADLERELVEVFGLTAARVVPTQQTSPASKALVLTEAADFLRDIRPRPRAMAFGWGRTLAGLGRAMPDEWGEGIEVVQACGVPPPVAQVLGADFIRLLADKAPSFAHAVEAPNIARSVAEARQIMSSISVRAALAFAAAAEVCVYTPSLAADSSILVRSGCITAEELEDVVDLGAQVNVLGRFVGEDGAEVSASLSERTVALTLEQLRKIRTLVIVGTGRARGRALAWAARTELGNVTVTDSQTAEEMLNAAA